MADAPVGGCSSNCSYSQNSENWKGEGELTTMLGLGLTPIPTSMSPSSWIQEDQLTTAHDVSTSRIPQLRRQQIKV